MSPTYRRSSADSVDAVRRRRHDGLLRWLAEEEAVEPAAEEPLPGALEPVEERPHQLDRAETTTTTILLLTLVVPAPAVVLVAAVQVAAPVGAEEVVEEAEAGAAEAVEDHLPPYPLRHSLLTPHTNSC